MTILVPRGAEAVAVRRAGVPARIVELPPGAAAASALPAFDADETVVVLGLCGALRRLESGDVVIYARVSDGARTFVLDRPLVDALTATLPGALVVDACTAERVVTSVAARTALSRRFDADVVDMEGAHLAAALGARGVRFAMVRVVSDDASRELPPIGDAIDAQGRLRPARVALAFARAPRAAFAFVRNVRRALATLTATAQTVGGMEWRTRRALCRGRPDRGVGRAARAGCVLAGTRRRASRHLTGPFSRANLAADVRALGVVSGDVVMVHAGLRSVGPVVGGVNSVVYALLDAVGATGTLVAYADWETGVDDWDDRSIDDAIPVFDKRIARAARDHGILAETLRTWPGAVRSDHPDAGIVAIGPHAERLCENHPLRFGYGEGSPFAKLVALPAKILTLGAPLDTITLLHYSEHAARIPGKRTIRYRRKLLRAGVPEWVEIEEFDTALPVVDGLPDDFFGHIAADYLAEGNGKRGFVGAADSALLDAAGLHEFAVRWLEDWAARRGAG